MVKIKDNMANPNRYGLLLEKWKERGVSEKKEKHKQNQNTQ